MVGAGLGVALTGPAFFLAIISAGLGHGTYLSARLFFPYAMLLTRLTSDTIAAPSIAAAIVQLPVEGALVGLALESRRPLFAVLIGVAHLIAFLLCSSLDNFTGGSEL